GLELRWVGQGCRRLRWVQTRLAFAYQPLRVGNGPSSTSCHGPAMDVIAFYRHDSRSRPEKWKAPTDMHLDKAVSGTLVSAAMLGAIGFGMIASADAQVAPAGPPAVGVMEAVKRPVIQSSEFLGRIEAT